MDPTITLDGLTLNPPASDGTGLDAYDQNGLALSGWYGSPAKKVSTTPLPYAPGAYVSPGYDDMRTIGVNGTLIAASRAALLALQRQLSGICKDPAGLYPLQVVDETGTLAALVRRNGAVLIKQVSDLVATYSLSVIAPDPRLLAATVQAISTPMAQPGAGGVQWNGPTGSTGVQWNGGSRGPLNANLDFETGTSPWTVANGTVVQSTTQKHTGSYAAKLTPNGSSATNTLTSEQVAVTAGTSYTVSAWVWFTSSVTTNYSTSVSWYNAAGSLLSTSSAAVSVTATTWTQVQGTYTAPATAAFAAIVTTLSGTPAAGQIWYVDDALLSATAGTGGVSWGQPGPTGVITLNNTAGNAPADLVLTIRGPAQNPSVSTATQSITYGGTLAATDVLAINTGTGSVLLNGVNRRSYLTRAQFFPIPANSTLDIRFTADVQNSTAVLTASWQVSYI